ncbi:MAG: PqqD family protein [Bacteroidales bacterium]|nr:PqqD family protein [Bacteroidales bacterium]
MKIKEGFILRKICGEFIVVGEGLAQVNFNKMLTLNASAAYLWEAVVGKDSFTEEDLVQLLLDQYEVDPETARADVKKLTETWIEQGVAQA